MITSWGVGIFLIATGMFSIGCKVDDVKTPIEGFVMVICGVILLFFR